MDVTHHDPAVWKRQQREQWSTVAQGWQRRWVAFERGAQPLSDRMMELAHVASGHKILDVATGIGEPAMTAARKAGPSGSVVAIDQATQMLEVARERMQAAGIGTVEFASVDELLGHLEDVWAPIRMIMVTLSPLDQAEFWKKLAEAAARFADADGMIRLPNACLVAAGQRLRLT